MQSHPQTILQVNARTWNRDSHDLFDYEATNVARTLFMVQTSGRCVRTANRLNVIPENQDVNDGEYLLRVIQREDKYWIMPPERLPGVSTLKKVWMIVKNLPNNQHALSEGDVIKLGRFRLRVRQICANSTSPIKLDDGDQPLLQEPSDPEKTQCRICLLEGGPHEEPLIAPCLCKGSIEYVHLGCLKHWIGAKQLTTNIDAPGCFYYKQPLCELCRSVLPHSIRLLNKESKVEETFNITSIPDVNSPYIVLESMAVQGHQQRGVHILTMPGDRKHLKLGRGHESEIRIPDVSISRYHASLRMIDDKFYIEDHDSKFGTLVLIKKPISVTGDKNVVVQIGRTVIEAQLSNVMTCNKSVIYNGICENIIQENEEMVDTSNDNNVMASLLINSQTISDMDINNQNNNQNNQNNNA